MELYGIPIDYWRGFVSALALVAMVYVWRMDVDGTDEPAFRDLEVKREDELDTEESEWAIPFGGQVGLDEPDEREEVAR